MSLLTKYLGLDKNPKLLAELNAFGHTLGQAVLAENPTLEEKLFHSIDTIVTKGVDAAPIPAEVGGVTKLFLAAELKMETSSLLADYEPVPNGQGETPGKGMAEGDPSAHKDGAAGGFGGGA